MKIGDIAKRWLNLNSFYRLAFFKQCLLGPQYRKPHSTYFTEQFREYYYKKEKHLITEKLRKLKKNLPRSDKETVDRVWNRYCRIIPLNDFKDYFLQSRELFTEEEIEDQAQFFKKRGSYKEKYNLDESFNPDIFYYDLGLACLRDACEEYIRDKTFLDIGAYNGDSLLIMEEYSPELIHAFEPSSQNFSRLNNTISKNNIDAEVETHQLVVGAESKKTGLTEEGESSKVKQRGDLDCIALDNKNLQDIGFVKLDVEGYEKQSLDGMKQLLERDRPVLSVSIYHNPSQFLELKPWLSNILQDYKFRIKKLNPFHPVHETTLIAYPSEMD